MKFRVVLTAACVMMLSTAMSTAQAADASAAPAASSPSIIARATSLPGAQTLTPAEMGAIRGTATELSPPWDPDSGLGLVMPIELTTEITPDQFDTTLSGLLLPLFGDTFVVMPID